jgi:hypothetical protein
VDGPRSLIGLWYQGLFQAGRKQSIDSQEDCGRGWNTQGFRVTAADFPAGKIDSEMAKRQCKTVKMVVEAC